MIGHHELCFGCGQQNPFGLQIELEPTDRGGVAGRFFVKQDHQGPPGYAHGGIMAAALDEAMSLLIQNEGKLAYTGSLEIELLAPAPVGAFVELEAELEQVDGRKLMVSAAARGEAGELARGRATFIERAPAPTPE